VEGWLVTCHLIVVEQAKIAMDPEVRLHDALE
jgi:hypothetical protein